MQKRRDQAALEMPTHGRADIQWKGSPREEFTEACALPTLGVLWLQVWNLLLYLSLLLKFNTSAPLEEDGFRSALSIINSPNDHE